MTFNKNLIFFISGFFILSFIGYNRVEANPIENKIFKKSIRTVQLFRSTKNIKTQRQPAIIPINQSGLYLEFDDLAADASYYFVKIIPCDLDWTAVPSISGPEFLQEYNEFPIEDYDFSFDTKVEYVHFSFLLPRISRSGNYIVQVYEDNDESKIVLNRRFMVYQKSTQIIPENKPSGTTLLSRLNHQINFKIRYPDLKILNPLQEIKVVLRQNKRWDNAQYLNQPSFLREDLSELEYRYFNYEHAFMAGNQFRFFDLRSVRYPGQNVFRNNTEEKIDKSILMADKSRKTEAFSIYVDMSGDFVIENRDKGGTMLEADYLQVYFTLKQEKLQETLYLFGQLTDWTLKEEAKMLYENSCSCYTGNLFLKQGWYDYQYIAVNAEGKKSNTTEGDHFETQNFYEILVYYKPQGAKNHLIIGYLPLSKY